MVTLKTSWNNVRTKAKVQGRWHDNRHTLITDLAESGAGDETIRDIAGHVSKQMLKHYSHIRMEAKRRALEAIVPKAEGKAAGSTPTPDQPEAQIQGGGTALGTNGLLVN
jgi:integrase